MNKADVKYWVGFSHIPRIGHVKTTQLENYFCGLEKACQADAADLKRAGLDRGSLSAVVSLRPEISLDEEMAKLERFGVRAFTWHDPQYPARLKEIYDYPAVLLCPRLADARG